MTSLPKDTLEGALRTLTDARSDRCPNCQRSLDGAPYCTIDGGVGEPFVVAGRYRVERCIGMGGMAVVFLAEHLALGKSVALKVLRNASDAQAMTRFAREARIAGQLAHENIVRGQDFGFDEALEIHYLAMEYLPGQALADVGTLSVGRALNVLTQLARALASTHSEGILHRDVTPKNVLVTHVDGNEVVKLCDFGVGYRLGVDGVDDADARLTVSGEWIGTPAYFAPEQIRGDTLTSACDVYAWGTIAYELLSGELPFHADSAVALIA